MFILQLFNSKTLARHIKPDFAIPAAHRDAIEKWVDLIKSNRINSLKEVALHGDTTAARMLSLCETS